MSGLKVIKRTPDLGIKIRLQPVVVPAPALAPGPAAGGCPCEATGVAWADIPHLHLDDYGDWLQHAPFSPSLDTPGRMQIEQPQDYGAWSPTVRMVGVPLGAQTAGVTWVLDWLTPATYGVSVASSGPVFIVTIPPRPVAGDGFDPSVLQARALCGDVLVGTLELEILRSGY